MIIRAGKLAAEAGIGKVALVEEGGRTGVALELTRTGNRSLYGDLQIVKAGMDPIVLARGVAIYPEIDHRAVRYPVPEEFTGSLAGVATVQYVERTNEGTGRVLAQAEVVLR